MAKAPLTDFFTTDIYPPEARNAGNIGSVRAIIIVAADGTPKDCKIVNRIGPAFDKVTCEQAMKMPYSPGLDEKGMPTQTLVSLNIRWTMGD